MRAIPGFLLTLVLTSSLLAIDEPTETTISSDETLLAEHAIEPTFDGVTSYLLKLIPGERTDTEAQRLIAQLADSKFSVRESAMKEILELPIVPVALLKETLKSPDSEVAHRARAILNDPKTKAKLVSAQAQNDVTAAVLRVIRDKQIKKKTSLLILDIAPYLDSWELEITASEAAAAVAETGDMGPLRNSILDERAIVRMVAIRALGAVAGKSANTELRKLCDDPDQRVALMAALSLAEQSDRTALETLVILISSDKQNVRVRSIQILRALTEQNFKLNPYVNLEDQKEQLDRWAMWLASEGNTAQLHLPITIAPLPEDLSTGLLVHYHCNANANEELTDVGANKRHGTRHNATEYVPRGDGTAIRLTANQKHGDSGGHVILPFIDFSKHDEFTVALWVKEAGMIHEEGEAYITFGTDGGVGTTLALGIAHLNHEMFFRVGEGQVAVPYVAADIGRWTHFAMTFEHDNLKAYRNGILIGENKAAKVSVRGTNAALGRHWWGDDGRGTSSRFSGELDDVRIYIRALTRPQIKMLMDAVE